MLSGQAQKPRNREKGRKKEKKVNHCQTRNNSITCAAQQGSPLREKLKIPRKPILPRHEQWFMHMPSKNDEMTHLLVCSTNTPTTFFLLIKLSNHHWYYMIITKKKKQCEIINIPLKSSQRFFLFQRQQSNHTMHYKWEFQKKKNL